MTWPQVTPLRKTPARGPRQTRSGIRYRRFRSWRTITLLCRLTIITLVLWSTSKLPILIIKLVIVTPWPVHLVTYSIKEDWTAIAFKRLRRRSKTTTASGAWTVGTFRTICGTLRNRTCGSYSSNSAIFDPTKNNVKVQKLKGGESDTFIVEKFKEVKREIERTW